MSDYLNTIRLAYSGGPFQQLHLLTTSGLIRHAHHRGIAVDSASLQLFRDLIQPIEPPAQGGEALYHPYQTWVLDKLRQAYEPRIPWATWASATEPRVTDLVTHFRRFSDMELKRLKDGTESFYKLLTLLALCEPAYLPAITRVVSLRSGSFTDYVLWRQSFDIHTALSQSEMRIEDIVEWRERLEWDAEQIDPALKWRALIMQAGHKSRDALSGLLRLAHDYYEMREVLRHVIEDVQGTQLPDDDVRYLLGKPRGALPDPREIPVTRRTVLKRVVRSLDLDPSYKGFWFLEGDTEVGFFQELALASGIDLEEVGIALVNLGGGGDVTQIRRVALRRLRSHSLAQILERLRQDEVFSLFTLDGDPDVREGLEKLRRLDLLTAGFFVWPQDFEMANFRVKELIHVVGEMFGSPIDGIQVESFAKEVRLEMAKTSPAGELLPMGQALVRVARRKAGFESFRRSEEWGRALARLAIGSPDLNDSERPALRAFQHALSMSWANFPSTVENMACSPSGELTPRQSVS